MSWISFVVRYTLVKLGYCTCIGLQKSILLPSQSIPYLGFKCDSRLQAFCLLLCKKEKFISLIQAILNSSQVPCPTYRSYPGSVYLCLWRFRAPGYLRTRSTWPSRALHIPLGHSPCQSLCAMELNTGFSSSPGLVFSLPDRSDTTNLSCTPMPPLMPEAAFWTLAELLFLLLIIGLTKSCPRHCR